MGTGRHPKAFTVIWIGSTDILESLHRLFAAETGVLRGTAAGLLKMYSIFVLYADVSRPFSSPWSDQNAVTRATVL